MEKKCSKTLNLTYKNPQNLNIHVRLALQIETPGIVHVGNLIPQDIKKQTEKIPEYKHLYQFPPMGEESLR